MNIRKAIQQENKQIKDEIRLLREKVNGQSELINELRKTNDKFFSNQNTLSAHNSIIQTHQINLSSETSVAKVDSQNTKVANEIPQSKSYAMVTAPNESFTKDAAVAKPNNCAATTSHVQNVEPHADFTIVGKNNKPILHSKRHASVPVFGTRAPSRNTIAGKRIVREFDVFIGGISNDINEEGLEQLHEAGNQRCAYKCRFKSGK